ncbi:hypothetical protein ElyMa_006912300 [Elysia marginata]|uniref:Uncharacterized protein n=1 Tax=Elysia marginata TaxID=1093978 RepID=A0AAV4JIY9_9GAST|nr:hypothetical protein ElyMa_006912300 [Elysia marginata]
MRVLPVVQLNTNSFDLAHPTHSIGKANETGSVGTVNSTETNRQADEGLSFEVAFTNAIERRMRCESLDIFLSECQLMECRQPAVFTRSQHSKYRYGGLACEIPDMAAILQEDSSMPVQACTCLRALSAMSKLGWWSVAKETDSAGLCLFRLTVSNQDKTPSFTSTNSDTGRDTATSEDGGQPPAIAEFSSIVEEKMLNLWSETKDACPLDRNSRKINVLMFTKTMYDARDDPLISFKLPGELRMSSGARPIHNLYSQGRQRLQISILAACFLSLSVFCFTHSFLLSSQES